jgi:outer membrane autotransporter protein
MFCGRSAVDGWFVRVIVCAVLAILWVVPVSYAQPNLTWDANGATAGTGGTGPWNTSASTWHDGTTFQAWDNSLSANAIFGGTAGTVTLGGPITAQNLTFSVTGYTLTGNTLTLAGLAPALSLTTGTTTIASGIAGAAGLTTTGAGSLTLSGVSSYSGGFSLTNSANTYTGATTIQSGTLQIGNGGTTGSLGTSSHVVVNNGALRINRTGTVTMGQAISGTGSLTKLATGTAILTGDNSYTGMTTISGGILQIGNGSTAGTLGTGNVAVTGTTSRLQINRSDTITLGQTISGTGNLTQAGTGTTILTGNNTYATTTITAGTLQIGAGGTTGSLGTGAVTVATGSTLAINRSNTLGLQNVISGAGSVNQAGSGTTILLGRSTYSGATTISAGTLQIGNGLSSNFGHIGSGAVINNGTLVFNRHGAENDGRTIANVISGTGTLVQNGPGTIWLTGTNTYTGPTIINLGTLSLGPLNVIGGATGDLGASSQVQVMNAGTLQINRSNAISLGQAISGTGQLTKLAAGVATLTGNNTYTGATTISGGTLQIGDGGSTGTLGSGNVLVSAGALLAVNRDNAYVVNNTIAGAGALTHMGTGTTILTGANSYTGSTNVNAGTLSVDGSLVSPVFVNSGGRLMGDGPIGGLTMNSGGSVAPGSSIGTLNIAGNVSFAPGSIYQVEADAAGQADKIAATGTATLTGGTVEVLAAAGNYGPATTYTILTATGGVTGTFANATSNLAFLTPTLTYDPNDVFLTLTRNTTPFSSAAQTSNQRRTAAALDALGTGPAFDAVALGSEEQARRAFDLLSGEIHATGASAMLEESRYLREAVVRRLRQTFSPSATPLAALAPRQTLSMYASAGSTAHELATAGEAAPGRGGPVLTAWGEGVGSWGRTEGDGNAARLDRSTGGVLLGADGTVDDRWRLGLAGGYTRSSLDVDGRRSSASIDSYHLSAYGGAQLAAVAVRLGAAYAWHNVETSRAIDFGSFSDRTKARYDARAAQVFGEVGYGIALRRVAIEPFAGFSYVNLDTDRFSEKGGAAALTGFGGSQDVTFSTLGVRSAARFALTDRIMLTARGALGWRHAFGDVTPATLLAFRAGGTPFTIAGVPIARNSLVAEAGLELALSGKVSVGLGYDGQVADNAKDHAVQGNLSIRF